MTSPEETSDYVAPDEGQNSEQDADLSKRNDAEIEQKTEEGDDEYQLSKTEDRNEKEGEEDNDQDDKPPTSPPNPDRSDSPEQTRTEVPPLRQTAESNDQEENTFRGGNTRKSKSARQSGRQENRPNRTRSAAGTSRRGERSTSQSPSRRGSAQHSHRQSYRFEMTGRSASAGRMSRRERRSNILTRNFQGDDIDEIYHDASRYQRSPGPVYDVGPDLDKHVLRRSAAFKIGTAPRTSSVHTIGPGPAYHGDVTNLASHPRSPRTVIGKAPRDGQKKDPTPSPSQYQAPSVDLYKRHQPRTVFGKERRGGIPGDPTPGPSDYTAYSSRKGSSTRGTFSTQERGTGSWIFM
ncbi:hypothetical protein BLNAU_11764 [Blattamonas nauphoetae]|uniref:Uncharacterized protein n=1 Tax=Blattamonas nauphoetae TaxID=2049346 RepID=A0ABQ9XLK1_9EUKA|nr:hypothetical protein BLNAU_11764 [Blattamonas nauphoetae]